jgi:hypothetical protein
MTSPSLVILTEPANCALADGQLLLQAVLQAQQLSREGVPVSQAFCDNPAAAESFVEAYTNAFAGLQLQFPDLPLPEQLYTLMADGRLAPLPGLVPDGSPMPDGAATPQPLVVLSMGSPDALMQALQSNRFAKRNINVVEIAPVEQAGTASVTLAAAVAAHALAGASWSPDASPSSRFGDDEDEVLASSDGSANAPLKLDSAEYNLNFIETRYERDQAQRSESAAAIVEAAADVSAAGGRSAAAGETRSVHADDRVADSSNAASPASQPDPGLGSETRNPAVTAATTPAALEPAAAAPGSPEPVVVSDPTPTPVGTDAEEGTPADPPLGAEPVIEPPSSAGGPETANPTPIGSGADAGVPDAEQTSELPGEIAAPSASGAAVADTTEPVEDPADDGSSFSDPGEDVVYPPTGSFTSDDDLPYPLPLAAASEADGLGAILRMSLAGEIVDFEAMSYSADHAMLTAEPFDPILMRAGGPDGLEHQDFHGSPEHADAGHREKPMPQQDTHQDETVTPVHDLDL